MKFLHLFILICFLTNCTADIKYPDGGYDYPKAEEVTDTNFYCYPIRKIQSKPDSFLYSNMFLFYRAFNEPNLSTKYLGKDIFRLVYVGFKQRAVLINLTADSMVVKQGSASWPYNENPENFTPLEKQYFRFKAYYYPSDNTIKQKINRDSLITLYPKLLDAKYLIGLTRKIIVPNNPPFSYTTTRINLSKKEYNYLINLINTSGYWSQPYKIECKEDYTDGASFILEANTRKKYNYVSIGDYCPSDSSRLRRVCQKLLSYAGLVKQTKL